MKTNPVISEFASFTAKVVACLPQFLSPGKMAEYANDPENLRIILDQLFNSERCYLDVVNYEIPFEEVIALGKYYQIEEDINKENFNSSRLLIHQKELKEVIFEVITFNDNMGTDNILDYIKNKKVRLATPYELVYFAFLHPELQKRVMIQSLMVGHKSLEPRNALCLSYHPEEDQRILVRSFYQNYHKKKLDGFLVIHL